MVNGIRTIYSPRLNKGSDSSFRVVERKHLKKAEGDIRKHCDNNSKDEDNNLYTLNDKNYPASSQKF